MKVCTVVGARPQFVKAAALSRALKKRSSVKEVLIHTGQHYDRNMSELFFDQLQIPVPDYNLGIGSGEHGAQTGRMLEAIEGVLIDERPDWVVLYGDTNSTLAGGLAAVKRHFPVAHVEAGLRSFNWRMPEEVNRVLADRVSDLLFAPTETAVRNLEREGIPATKIHLVGDVMHDLALFYAKIAESRSAVLDSLGLAPKSYALATIHRAENTDDPVRLKAVFEGLAAVAEDLPAVLPLHPRTRAALERENLFDFASEKLVLIDPVGYLDMVWLERNACLIVTDSGGVQKEAFFYRVPCVTLRDETEWVELVDLGWNRLVPPRAADQVAEGIRLSVGTTGREASPYGEGNSTQKIVRTLLGESAAKAS